MKWVRKSVLPGRRVTIELDEDTGLLVNGERPQDIYLRRYRDGGSTVHEFWYKGQRHEFRRHRRIGEEHYESLDGERIERAD